MSCQYSLVQHVRTATLREERRNKRMLTNSTAHFRTHSSMSTRNQLKHCLHVTRLEQAQHRPTVTWYNQSDKQTDRQRAGS